jgi:hypothetical protein
MGKSFLSKRLIIAGFLFLGFFLVATPLTHAQTTTNPKFLVTWKAAGSYVPPSYIGKALPSYASKITASLELVSQGKILNLQAETIYWYLDGVLIGGGEGIQNISFPSVGTPPDILNLKVELPNYASGYLTHSINIPLVKPLAVLYTPFPSSKFSTNPLTVQVIPYFFNVSSPSSLSYTWAVNGQKGGGAENPESAQVTLPSGTPSGTNIDVSVTVENPTGSTVATADENLVYESRL